MLSNIIINHGVLTPAFSPVTNEYSVEVEKSIETLGVTAVFDDGTAMISGTPATSDVAVDVAVVFGTTNIAISHITGDITTNYIIKAHRLRASDREIETLRASWRKLDGLGYSFGLPMYSEEIPDWEVEKYFYGDLQDTMRELKIQNLDNVDFMDTAEMFIENRVVYYALRRFRNSSSVFFKFSTATDGKSVDKSMIPKMLAAIIAEYNSEWTEWRKSLVTGSLWTIARTVQTDGEFEEASS